MIWIYTVCKDRVYLGSAGQGLIKTLTNSVQNTNFPGRLSGKYLMDRQERIGHQFAMGICIQEVISKEFETFQSDFPRK